MSIGMSGIRHVKIPVTDLPRSVSWYAQVMDLVPLREFVERGACAESRCAARRASSSSR